MGKQQTASEMLNALVHGARGDSNQTKLHPSQPLNVIAGDGLDDASPGDTMAKDDVEFKKFDPSFHGITKEDMDVLNNEKDSEKEDENSKYNEICKTCQIITITGTCAHCGIHLYCSGAYPELPVQFDITVRRRQ